MTTGEKILALREENNLTQQQLADAIGFARSMVAQVERGSRPAPSYMVKKCSELFGVSADDLL